MIKPINFLITISLVCIALLFMNLKSTNKTESFKKNVSELYEVKALKLPNYMEFAGEEVPLNQVDVRERLDRELLANTYWQSNGLLLIKRANKYLPIIEPILKKYGLPDDFKYLAIAESGLQNVTSSAGASGFWQFLKSTGKEYGLEINDNVDERYHLEKATEKACEYLIKSKEKFGSWALAAAAYNAGNNKIALRLEQQKVNNYFDLLLNLETGRYVFRILALKEILSNPQKYGFSFDDEDLYTYPKVREVEVNKEIPDLADFAKQYGITYKDLKLVNPWLRQTKLDSTANKTYVLKIPIKK